MLAFSVCLSEVTSLNFCSNSLFSLCDCCSICLILSLIGTKVGFTIVASLSILAAVLMGVVHAFFDLFAMFLTTSFRLPLRT